MPSRRASLSALLAALGRLRIDAGGGALPNASVNSGGRKVLFNGPFATLMPESLAEYTARMALKHEYGPEHVQRFMKYEMNGSGVKRNRRYCV